jgi:hypothetical protein
MRRIHASTLALLTLLAAVVAALVALAIRRASVDAAPISRQVNDLVATFEIPLHGTPANVHAIPGWVTLVILAGGAIWAGRRLAVQRARSKRS